jgi:hypothetical protein
MKLSKYIDGLNEILKEHGDLDVFMSSDAEGNDIHSTGNLVEYQLADLSPISGNSIVKGIVFYPEHDNWDYL